MSDSQKLRFLLKDCADGFYQQMYFLGKDVIRSEGNQLMEYGFEKSPSLGLKGTSCYGKLCNNCLIELYGSCAGAYSDTSRLVYLRKRCRFYHWRPDYRLVAGQWSNENVDAGEPEEVFTELSPLLKWWVDYEAWIEKRFGSAYREQCYKDWGKIKSKASWLPPGAAKEWVGTFLEKKDEMVRSKQFA